MYTPDDLQITDALSHIRQHPEMYLPDGRVTGSTLLCRILADVLVTPNCGVLVEQCGEWCSIGSTVDWLGVDARRAFFEFVPFPEAGQNAYHAVVLLAALADDVVLFDDKGYLVIVGQVPSTEPVFELPRKHSHLKRLISFRMQG